MKKKIAIILLCIITVFSNIQMGIGIQVLAEGIFPGSVAGSTISGNDGKGKGTVTVTGAPTGAELTLYRAKDNSSVGSPLQVQAGQNAIFQDVDAGRYYVKATVGTTISDASPIVHVQPNPVTIHSEENSTTITVSGGVSGGTFTLYKDDDGTAPFTPRTTNVDGQGNGKFELVPPGKNYRVKQVIDSVESAPSNNGVTIRPNKVAVIPSADAGPNNDQGTLQVLESKAGNIIRVYFGEFNESNLLDSKPADSQGGYTFTGLKAGKYFVTQRENGAESLYTEVIIKDAQAPVITLNGDSEITLVHGEEYKELGATVTDNIDGTFPLPSENIKNPITKDSPPGIYIITYNATDTNGNKAVEVTRKVIIKPKRVKLTATHTSGASTPDGPNGDITVQNVYPGSILYLYQDPGGQLIKTYPKANAEVIDLKDIPVGKGYFVIQEYKNENGSTVMSEPSERIEIKDTTPPKLTLNGDNPIKLTMGDQYIEYGATATDNVDSSAELSAKIQISGNVDTNKPGTYTITYNVTDKAGNSAASITRTIIVNPKAVTAIGSKADIGEVGVKNGLPGAILTLYYSDGKPVPNQTYTLKAGETTHVFKDVKPGKYYVTQTVGALESLPSNVVEVVDIDRPHITLEGPEKLSFVWNEDAEPYYDGVTHKFTDPGATAEDYIDGNLTEQITTTLTLPDGTTKPCNKTSCNITFTEPGVYKITYNVMADRGTVADPKQRTITVTPPKLAKPTSETGTSMINVSSVFNHSTSVVHLYNTYDQLIESKAAKNTTIASFKDIPAGLGYYVTQTVNGIESAPSETVNVSSDNDADKDKLIGISSFRFSKEQAFGVINQEKGTITVTVPKGTDRTKLTASFTTINGQETVWINGQKQTSGTTVQNFTNSVTYEVKKTGATTKTYRVTVSEASGNSNTWTSTLKRNINVYTTPQTFTLSPEEQQVAVKQGVSFVNNDLSIHVSPVNVKESSSPSLNINSMSKSSMIKPQDPSWKNNLSNIIELNWGQTTQSFLQPIEVELPNAKDKTFVRLIRENDQLYAIVQPTETVGSSMVGLATEPGTYALLDKVNRPIITTSTNNGETTYKISSYVSGAKILYTADSNKVSFDRSARKNLFKSHLFFGNPSDLQEWQPYKGPLTNVHNGDLYAVAVKDQIISAVTAAEPPPMKEWSKDYPVVPRHKVWEIKYNTKVDKKALYSDVIYVTDDVTKANVPVSLQLSADGKTIFVAPLQPYEANKQYTLWIEKEIKGQYKNTFLKQPTKMTFIAK
ncbi:hypothetical protein CD798_15640 [Bacillaceae bacterium SAOS 7]|nr:hypothetical protein CD798_15640 [Bacillaceae bacterium SAOS 7]